MLSHGTPWQAVIASAFLRVSILLLLLFVSVISGYFHWYPAITAILLLCSFVLLVRLIPTFLNLSRSYWVGLVSLFFLQIAATISSFALYYWNAGIISKEGEISKSLVGALYFSITTFTTLGYGDFCPPPSARLATSMEALAGMVSMAIGASLVWLWCQENMIDKEMAFFDGYRRNKKSLSVTRKRVRTITGKPRELSDWAPAPNGESYFWSEKLREWVVVDDEHQPTEGDFVMRVSKEDEEGQR